MGWKHAKLSGHKNEQKLKHLMLNDEKTIMHFLYHVGKSNCKIIEVRIGGLHETDVPCIFENEKTKSKTDMYVVLDDGSKYNISIKKSISGQVYLISIDRFVRGFEFQYSTTIPNDVKRAISLFWGSSDDTNEIIKLWGTKMTYELRKHRLVGDSLFRYDQHLYNVLLNWFKDNIYEITEFCFSRGLAINKNDWANVIWYINELGENKLNSIFLMDDLCERIKSVSNSHVFYGKVNGGTTIQLPFGFVQWHSPSKKIPGDMQFHHKYKNIIESLNSKNK